MRDAIRLIATQRRVGTCTEMLTNRPQNESKKLFTLSMENENVIFRNVSRAGRYKCMEKKPRS